MAKVALLSSLVTQAANVGNRPTLPTDGVDTTAWQRNRPDVGTPTEAVCFLNPTNAGAQVTAPVGGTGVELWGFALGAWWQLDSLFSGNTINLVATGQGFADEVTKVGAFSRLAIAGQVSAGTVSYQFCPMEITQP